jgi:hypothetical protein
MIEEGKQWDVCGSCGYGELRFGYCVDEVSAM